VQQRTACRFSIIRLKCPFDNAQIGRDDPTGPLIKFTDQMEQATSIGAQPHTTISLTLYEDFYDRIVG
jgi:hypothetical protein